MVLYFINLQCLKKVPPCKLSVTLSNLNRFSKKFELLESVWNLLQNPYDITHFASGMLLHYLGKLKIQIFCIYSADMEENANKLHSKCTESTDFNSSTHVTVCAECTYVFLWKSCPRRRIPCDCWQTLQWRLLWWISGAINWSQK